MWFDIYPDNLHSWLIDVFFILSLLVSFRSRLGVYSATLFLLLLLNFSSFRVVVCRQSHSTSGSRKGHRHVKSIWSDRRSLSFSHLSENSLDIVVLRCTGLDIRHVVVFGAPLFCFRHFNCSNVSFVTDQNKREGFRICRCSFLQEVFFPIVQAFKWFLITQIKHKSTCIWATIKGMTQRIEFLLPCCIPDLQV